jgi:hypothetical protein
MDGESGFDKKRAGIMNIFGHCPFFSLASPAGGEGRGEEAKYFQIKSTHLCPPRLGGEKESRRTAQRAIPHPTRQGRHVDTPVLLSMIMEYE